MLLQNLFLVPAYAGFLFWTGLQNAYFCQSLNCPHIEMKLKQNDFKTVSAEVKRSGHGGLSVRFVLAEIKLF